MLLFNRKEAYQVDFKSSIDFEADKHNDIALDFLEHFSYTRDELDLDVKFLNDNQHISECDYCGKVLLRDWDSRIDDNRGGRLSQNYADANDEFPFTNDACKNCVGRKNRVTNFINHGTIKNVKAIETMEKNGKVPTSRQQIYLSNLLNAQSNKYIKGVGFVDLILDSEDIVIEYDGSGHYIGTRYGRYTYEEKIESDYNRDKKLKELGYKIIRIHSEYDYLPSDEIIIEEIDNIKKYFDTTGKDFFKWIIPKSKKDKRYGYLREITEKDLNRG